MNPEFFSDRSTAEQRAQQLADENGCTFFVVRLRDGALQVSPNNPPNVEHSRFHPRAGYRRPDNVRDWGH